MLDTAPNWEYVWKSVSVCGDINRERHISSNQSSLPESPTILPVAGAEPSRCQLRRTYCATERKIGDWEMSNVDYVRQGILRYYCSSHTE